jgi:predicted DCC family thiol-disulfide oxidoreductase YuxK
MNPAAAAPGPVLFFDGECGLCQRVVRYLMRIDRLARLRYAPLQGATGQAYLRERGLPTEEFSSLVFARALDDPSPLLRTDGARAALQVCGGPGKFWAGLIGLFPRRVRDLGYRVIARVRYRVFGVWRPRPFPDPSWESRVLS